MFGLTKLIYRIIKYTNHKTLDFWMSINADNGMNYTWTATFIPKTIIIDILIKYTQYFIKAKIIIELLTELQNITIKIIVQKINKK